MKVVSGVTFCLVRYSHSTSILLLLFCTVTRSISIGMAINASLRGTIRPCGIHWDVPSVPPFIPACNSLPFG